MPSLNINALGSFFTRSPKSPNSNVVANPPPKRLSFRSLRIRPADITDNGILKLPAEILLEIFEFALTDNKGIGKLHRSRTIGLTCRRFFEVLLPVIYSNCKLSFQYSYLSDESGCIYSRDKLELSRQYGHYVRKLSILADCSIGPHGPGPNPIKAFLSAPSIASAIFDLAPSLTHLNTLEFDGRFNNGVPDLIHSLQHLLTNSPFLTNLSLSVHVRWNQTQAEGYGQLLNSIYREQSEPSVSYAPLSSLSISIFEDPLIFKCLPHPLQLSEDIVTQATTTGPSESTPVPQTPQPAPDSTPKLQRYYFIELLCKILKPCMSGIKSFHFNIPLQSSIDTHRRHRDQIETEREKFFNLPNLSSLSISIIADNMYSFYRFVKMDYSRVNEVKLHADLGFFSTVDASILPSIFTLIQTNINKYPQPMQFPALLTHFTSLRFLEIANIQELVTLKPSIGNTNRRPWWQIQPWKYIADSILLPHMHHLKVIKIGTTGDGKEVVEEGLGWEVTRRCEVVTELKHTRSVRESYEIGRGWEEGRWDSFGVRIEVR